MIPPSPQRYPTAFSALTGILLVLIFPRPQLTLLAWVALAPLLVVLTQRRSRPRLFFYGYLAGLIFFAGTCYWIGDVMRIYGRLPAAAAAAVLALFTLAMALSFGLFSLIVGELARRWQLGAILLSPFVWVAVEWLRNYVPFGGFPWNLLGYSIAAQTGWVQPAAYAGVYGLSFLVAAVNALVAAYAVAPSRRAGLPLLAAVVTLGGAWLWGQSIPPAPTTATAVLVQTNLPQQEDFDPLWVEHHPDQLQYLEQKTRQAVQAQEPRPVLVLWPEVPVSFYFHHDPVVRARLIEFVQSIQTDFLVGIIDYRPDPGEEGQAQPRLYPYNSAVLLSPVGELVGQYDKIHLVPFGEYLPFPRWGGWLGRLVEEVSDFRPGREAVVLPSAGGRLAVLICYEAIFPELVRSFVARPNGAEVLVSLSNDGWFGRSPAAAQHMNMARVRAVENRRWLLRATNTGITAVVDPYGRIVDSVPSHVRTTMAARFAPRRVLTVYAQLGDWLALLCALVTAAAVARKFWMQAVEGTGNGNV